MNYALVDKDSNRAFAIVEPGLITWFKQNLPAFEVIEIGSVGASTFSTDEGSISTISIFPKGKHCNKDAYHLISSFPDTISLVEAYDLIKS